MNMRLKEKIELLPRTSGVYKFFDKNGEILYIGKAINLKSRVSSYFNNELKDRPRIIPMIDLIEDIQVVQTDNDIEALVLESALVKKEQPKYNSDLKDDKSYAYLFVTTKDKYPTVKIVRQISRVEAKSGKLFGPYPSGRAIKRVFRYLRRIYPFCTSKDPSKPCFESYIGLCPGPSATHEEYMKNIYGIIDFLSGKNKEIIKNLEQEMNMYSQEQAYEKAAQIRDKINDLKYLTSKINFNYLETEEEYIDKRYKKFSKELQSIAEQLNLKALNRIECYDISNISGKNAYGSMVVNMNGIADTSLYRIFKIKGLDEPNDPAMLAEVLKRRLKHIDQHTDESLDQKPDIILLDGAITQLKSVGPLIPENIFLMGISKGRKYKRKGAKLLDEFWVYTKGDVVQVKLKHTLLLTQLRDEAHRFALLHHRKGRILSQTKSLLDSVKGLGPKGKKALIKAFGGSKEIINHSEEEIANVLKNRKVAKETLEYLRTNLKSKP